MKARGPDFPVPCLWAGSGFDVLMQRRRLCRAGAISAAAQGIANGADVGTVSKLMGHASPEMVLTHYQHVLTKQKKMAVEALPSLIAPSFLYGQKKRVATSVANPLKYLVRPERFELPTYWFVASCSIQLSHGRITETSFRRHADKGQAFFAGIFKFFFGKAGRRCPEPYLCIAA